MHTQLWNNITINAKYKQMLQVEIIMLIIILTYI